MRAYLIGHLDKFVGGLAHRRNDRHDTITTVMRIGEAAGDCSNFCWCLKTGTAVFLHDDGIVVHPTYRNTLRAPYMLARTNCERLPTVSQRFCYFCEIWRIVWIKPRSRAACSIAA